MITLNLTYVNRTPRTSAGGKPYTSLSLKATEYGNEYLSGFGNKDNEAWKVGDVVEVAEVKEVVKGDKKYLNFEMPKKANGGGNNAEVLEAIRQLRYQVDVKMIPLLTALCKEIVPEAPKTELDYPENNLGKSSLD